LTDSVASSRVRRGFTLMRPGAVVWGGMIVKKRPPKKGKTRELKIQVTGTNPYVPAPAFRAPFVGFVDDQLEPRLVVGCCAIERHRGAVPMHLASGTEPIPRQTDSTYTCNFIRGSARKVDSSTTPKVEPPPPRSAQKRSGFVKLLATRYFPSEVTILNCSYRTN
jgi:hypothetical protein